MLTMLESVREHKHTVSLRDLESTLLRARAAARTADELQLVTTLELLKVRLQVGSEDELDILLEQHCHDEVAAQLEMPITPLPKFGLCTELISASYEVDELMDLCEEKDAEIQKLNAKREEVKQRKGSSDEDRKLFMKIWGIKKQRKSECKMKLQVEIDRKVAPFREQAK